MAKEDDEFGLTPRRKPPAHEIGQPIEDLSAPELRERIDALKAEIDRLEQAIKARDATHAAAAAFFKS